MPKIKVEVEIEVDENRCRLMNGWNCPLLVTGLNRCIFTGFNPYSKNLKQEGHFFKRCQACKDAEVKE